VKTLNPKQLQQPAVVHTAVCCNNIGLTAHIREGGIWGEGALGLCGRGAVCGCGFGKGAEEGRRVEGNGRGQLEGSSIINRLHAF